jgi:hypothetical protein
MRCQSCSSTQPTHYVELHHNVGMLVMRRQYSTCGRLCRGCLHRAFGHHMLCNLTLGWWGTISFVMTCYFTVHNLATYLGALVRLRGQVAVDAPAAAAPAGLGGDAALERLLPYEHNVRLRLRAGDAPEDVGRDIAALLGIAAADAARFVERVRAAERR